MPIVLGNTTITGLAVGGLPAGSINGSDLASGAVTAAKISISGFVLNTVISTYQNAWAYGYPTANAWFNLPMSVSITPQFSNSKVSLMLNIGNSYIGNGGPYRILRNGSVMFQGDGAGSRALGMWKMATPYGTDQNHGTGMVYNYLDSPGTTSAISYTVQAYSERNVDTAYINASGSGYNNSNGGAYYSRTVTTFIAMEIAG